MVETISHAADLCVVGGGLSGMFAAITAARLGLKVCLMQDRPLVGGNASSEIRMWIRGAGYTYPEYRETGLLEELTLLQSRFNPSMTYVNWDGLLLGMVQAEENIELFLNCTCFDAHTENGRIRSVRGWQLTTYTFHEVTAPLFADCSGDCVLAPLSGAKFRKGRESRAEYNEPFAREEADSMTMGMSCMLQARECDRPVTYTPPPFAAKLSEAQFRERISDEYGWHDGNFWWLELGGDGDTVGDTERVRDRLVPLAYGVWDYIKNSGRYDADNWELVFVGFLPGKRESNRYIGDYVLTQNDLEACRPFDDEVAYGGWPVDDHDPRGFDFDGPPNWFHSRPRPYPIPYRTLYSVNVANLFVAGRNISCTHLACSSARVMGTCALEGQAVGAAAYLAASRGLDPRGVLGCIDELKQLLRELDCFLLNTPRRPSSAAVNGRYNVSEQDARCLLSGIERGTEGVARTVYVKPGNTLSLQFDHPTYVGSVRLVTDSDPARTYLKEDEYCFNTRQYPMRNHLHLDEKEMIMPPHLLRAGRIEYLSDGRWAEAARFDENVRRLLLIPFGRTVEGIRLTACASWGGGDIGVMSLDITERVYGRPVSDKTERPS